ncbi:hypothetical protein Poli38472_001035 [Pythium oligandrum]|uniref:Uncharacterized protein n=1 Tax=Pythium oligandrum TaxID=41045 RepID=A0A8K1FPZ6_PYTOL|nr:hypothetical protein Poli38472_001035 [Pythium oligandrum]|eukprot:TMW68879.1 hypothetical protein Poli38472_001035 [Pythium oligandrum]
MPEKENASPGRSVSSFLKRKKAPRRDILAVRIPWLAYQAFWFLQVLLRGYCIAFLAINARIYWFMAHPYMSYYSHLLGPTAVTRFKPIAVCFGLVTACHIFQLSKMCFYSIKLRRLAFEAPQDAKFAKASEWDMRISSIRGPKTAMRYFWRQLFHRRGFFGVESSYFHARFVLNEFFEIVSQTTQVYKASVLIGKVWINALYVALTVVNCWSTPILQYFFQHMPALERLLYLCIDLTLDMSSATVLPIVIFLPYYEKFNFETYNFEISYLYDDIWFANMVMENQQLFALSQWDFLWKIIPHFSIYACLNSIKSLVRPRLNMYTVHCDQPSSTTASMTVSPMNEDEHQPSTPMEDGSVPDMPRHITPNANAERLLRRLQVALTLWGLGILVLHLVGAFASMSANVPACKQTVRPWFTTRFSCAVLQFNCYRYNTTTVTNEDLEILQADSLAALVFSHCSELRVPTQLKAFKNLLGIDIYNSTLVEWNADAAITQETHPSVTYIIFVRVNMTRLPDGILQTLPNTMNDFEISVSNLTELPSDLHERWHPLSLAYFEYTEIKEFPPTLMKLPVDDLSLIGTDIEMLPEFPPDHPGFFTLAMTRTPLKALPANFGDTRAIGFLSLGYTQLTQLPLWMPFVARTADKVYVHHTPFCEGLSSETREKEYGENAVLTCFAKDDRVDGKYPLAIMAPRRLL